MRTYHTFQQRITRLINDGHLTENTLCDLSVSVGETWARNRPDALMRSILTRKPATKVLPCRDRRAPHRGARTRLYDKIEELYTQHYSTTRSVQELTARVDILEAKVARLEGALTNALRTIQG